MVTATACSLGCLWRGFAKNLTHLQMGAILNGVGVNLWTVVLGHLVKSFPPSKRSEVLSGIGVQLAIVQIGGKALFPFVEYGLKNAAGISVDLVRYRIHMGFCTAFCFYGTVALFWDRYNIGVGRFVDEVAKEREGSSRLLKEKQSDLLNGLEEGLDDDDNSMLRDQITLINDGSNLVEMVEMSGLVETASSISTNQMPTQQPNETKHKLTSLAGTTDTKNSKNNQFVTTIILSVALFIQSCSNTILSVLWPLLIHDRFHLTAQTFGVLAFISSITSMGSMASFPLVEKKVGRVKCAAGGFGIAAVSGLLFCICSFDYDSRHNIKFKNDRRRHLLSLDRHVSNLLENDIGGSAGAFLEDYSFEENVNSTIIESLSMSQRIGKQIAEEELTKSVPYMWHAISAVAFQASLSFLEPSLKSVLSLAASSSRQARLEPSKLSLGFAVGYMTTIANLGGMLGNIAGTYMYKLSNERLHFFHQGSLPFFVCAILLGISSAFIWRLAEPSFEITHLDTENESHQIETAHCTNYNETLEDLKPSRDGCCLALLDRDVNHELKCE